ncbi:MAG: DUF3365 domain-containing protein [Nitrospirae bacterium]|nr:DUF3365 domain-containing protein [Nitrospirota bacterium]
MEYSADEILKRFKNNAISGVLLWTLPIVVSLFWNLDQHNQTVIELAKTQARTAFQKDLVYRSWSVNNSAVYVPVSEHTPPNPHLSHIKNRDITSNDGQRLTLINAAYMNRQVFEIEKTMKGVTSRLTSPNPLNPVNEPDEWEKKALQGFSADVKEISSTETVNGQQYLRFIMPFYVEESCLKCHYVQGYKIGELRGGLSISVPMTPIINLTGKHYSTIWIGHVLIWLLGVVFIFVKGRDTMRNARAIYESELEAQKAREAAEEANIAKSRFLANTSHEIRTPMNAVIGLTDLVLESKLSEEQRKHLEMVKESANILLTLLNEILDLSKIEAGKFEMDNQDFDLYSTLSTTIAIFLGQARKKGIGLDYKIDNDVPRIIKGDSLRLAQILINLIGNAIKFTEKGEVICEVSNLQSDDSRFVSLNFAVKDTGIGIAKDRVAYIFDAFTQADAGTARRFGGSGLGLTITKKLVELMNGKIRVESEPGQGSSFFFSLKFEPGDPFNIDKQSAMEPVLSTAAVQAAAELHSSVRRLKILVVEDNFMNQVLMTNILEKYGHLAVIANSGRMAIELLKKDKFDLVLMDVNMPEMDGLETTRIIRTSNPDELDANISIIATTASAMKEDRERCLEAGMNGYVTKPINVGELIRTIREFIPEAYLTKIQSDTGSYEKHDSVINVSEAIDRLGGSLDLFVQVTRLFIEKAPLQMKELSESFSLGDLKSVERFAHNMKAAAGTIGAYSLRDIAAHLESAVKSSPDKLDQIFPALEEELKKVLEELAEADMEN